MAETERDTWGVAIVGMAGRFPGARSVDELWDVLAAGRETIRDLTDNELRAHELDFDAVRDDPAYVRRRGILDDADLFDAAFFGIPPREASLIDPQQRVWLETVWQALEDSGLAPAKFGGKVGVFAGSYINGYLLYNLCRDRAYIEKLVRFRAADAFQALISNDKDYITTRTSYKLDLKGPSVNVQTACSTSLVAVCQAVKSLLNHESDACIAGGVAIPSPQYKGYLHQEGAMTSRDGHCRPFDADASGTVFSAGVGVVVLKRLEDALADGDRIRAVIKGVAVNNDGSNKVSFTAPSVDGQAEVVAMAQAMADVDPATITYIEAHGTATPLGDPIEVAALTRAFRMRTERRRYCGIGSVKSNLGHLDAASGVAGLIKTVLAMEHRALPPSLHYRAPNPQIDFGESPFYVVDELREWRSEGVLRAGVSSFGVGGTNAHVVLEEAPPQPAAAAPDAAWQVLPLSAKTAAALARRASDLREFLERTPHAHWPSVARTLQEGRADMEHRSVVVARTAEEAVAALRGARPSLAQAGRSERTARTVGFMFPGQGAQHPDMGRELYESEPVFRAVVDRCAESLREAIGSDLRDVLYPAADRLEAAADALRNTALTQPALFVVELATATLWRSLGIEPAAMIGHSVGEYVAACLAGVMSEADALRLLAERGRLMAAQPAGSMLAVRLAAEALQPRLEEAVEIAASNAPSLCVVSGPSAEVERLRVRLEAEGVQATPLQTSHAFHSAMMDPVLAPFRSAFGGVRLSAPRVPFISSVTGKWITDEQACDPGYWVSQLRSTVRFSDGVEALAGRVDALLEVGPGRTLATLARQGSASAARAIVSTLPHAQEDVPARAALLRAAGQLWIAGYDVDWKRLRRGAGRMLGLPTYPFERQRYWIDPPALAGSVPQGAQLEAALPGGVAAAAGEVIAVEVASAEADPTRVVLEALRRMLVELSGMEFGEGQDAVSFLELGLDSLFLTQLSSELHSRFGVRVKFRQLFEEIATLDLLARHVVAAMPAEKLAALVPRPVAVPLSAPSAAGTAVSPPTTIAGTGANAIERLVQEQLRVMQLQLEALRGAAGGDAGAVAVPVASVAASSGARGVAVPAGYGASAASGRFGPYKQIERARDGGLTERQRAHLEHLTASLNARTGRSKSVSAAFRAIQADPRNIASFRTIWKEMVYQIVGAESYGSRLRDIDGNEYVDITMGFGINLFGHNAEWIRSAIAAQLERGFAIGPQGELAGEVARMLTEMTGMERASFCNTGSEAVMAAMRMARTVTGRDLVVYFAGDYHGVFDEVLARPHVANGRLGTVPIAPGIPQGSVDNILVLEYGNPASLDVLRSVADRVAAVLVEPVQSRHPELRPAEFVRALRELTTSCGAALIFDEVITGFRVHPGGMQAVYGVRADLATYGKIIGGGLPIGAVAGSARFMDTLDGGAWSFGDDSVPESDVTFFAGTFVRHPLALAAARAVLAHLKEQGPGLQQRLNERTRRFADELNVFFEDVGVPIRVRQYSSWFRFDFPADLVYAPLLFFHMLERGVYVREPGQNCFLSTAHSDADVDLVARVIRESTIELQEAGFLPGRASLRVLPLTGPQQEIRVGSELGSEASCAYNECFRIRLAGPLSGSALEEAVRLTTGRHEALRLRFDPSGTSQTVGPRPEGPTRLDLSGLEEDARERRLAELILAEKETPFDLVRGPLIRSLLVRLSEAEHVFLCTAHHIVFDGWSSAVFVEDVRDAYNALVRGVSPELKPAESFVSFLEQDAAADPADVAHWVSTLADPPAPLELPTDRPRPPVRSYAGETYRHEFSPAAYAAARELSRTQGVTLYCTLLSACYALLHELSGQDDLIIGIPIAGQSMSGRHHLVGHCLNLLPLRARAADGDSFAALCRAVRDRLLDAREHERASLGEIVRAVNPPRDPARLPLVEVIFNLDRRLPALDFEGLRTSVEECGKRSVNFDLFVNLNEVEGDTPKLTLNLDYSRELFDEATVAAWVRRYEQLLLRAAAAPDAPLARVRDAGVTEAAWLAGPSRPIPPTTLEQLVLPDDAAFASTVAIRFADEAWTREHLRHRVERLTAWLAANGVVPGERIGIALERSPDMVAVLLAVLRCGAAFVPMDPTFPLDRLRYIADDAAVRRVIASADLRDPLEAGLDGTAVLDPADAPAHFPAALAAGQPHSPEDVAYVLYTSGSTGRPKGVAVPHSAVVNFLTSMLERPGFTSDDTLVAVTTLSFDISLLELLLPLTAGGTLQIASADEARDTLRLSALLSASGATVMQATPTHWRALAESGWRPGGAFRAFVGGEPLDRELARHLLERCSEVWNLYGPTETTIWSTVERIESADRICIGRPIANTSVYVLDADMRQVPAGAVGEIWIGGAGVARGYVGRDELTRERFLPDPFSETPGARMYRTGDLGRWLADGRLEHRGRVDEQIKVRGHRVEPGEIESALLSSGVVRGAAVVLRRFAEGDDRLVAYVTQDGGAADTASLRAHLAQRLPDYMLPSHIIRVDGLPTTANGKLDRRALTLVPFAVPIEPAGQAGRPRSDAPTAGQALAARAFADVLQVDRVDPEANFFDLGGHSILAMRVIARLREEGTPALGLRDLFQAPTAAGLGGRIDRLRGESSREDDPRDADSPRMEIVF